MKWFFLTIILILVLGLAGTGILLATGLTTVEEVQRVLFGDEVRASLETTAQAAADQSAALISRLADFKPPQGESHEQEGELPEDQLPDFESLYTFPEERYPYRAMLREDEKSAYDQIYANAVELYDQFPLRTPLSFESIERAWYAVYYDHPELFWMDNTYKYYYDMRSNKAVSFELIYNEASENITAYQANFDAVVDRVVGEATQLRTDFEKEKFVHDYLVDNVVYDEEAPLNQSAYSALVYGQSVCAGYARAFQHILLELGIPCYFCVGDAGEPHGWNIIMLDDGYYHVDVTWDNTQGAGTDRRFYNYFNITDEEIKVSHTREDLSVNLPACNGTGYAYTGFRTPETAGFSRESAIDTLEDYYSHCEEQLYVRGEGTYNLTTLLTNYALAEQIIQLTGSSDIFEFYVVPAAMRMGWDGYSVSVLFQEPEELTDGYWLLTQQMKLSSDWESGDWESAA